MTEPSDCLLIGRWRLVEADLWESGYLDLVEPAHLQIGDDGWASFAFGVVTAGGRLEYARTVVFCRWSGSDEGTEISGEASVELQEDGTIAFEIAFDNGDEAIITGRRA